MAKARPKAGESYTCAEQIGIDDTALKVGTVVTVREIVAADERGAHDDSEDSVVVEWTSPALVEGENGPEVGEVPRAISVGLSVFHDQFTKED